MIDLSFRAIGMEVLAREWPAFAGGAAIQVYLAKRAHRSSHYRIQWIVFCASVAVIGIASMGVESTLVSERLHRDIGESDRRRRRSHGHLADRDVAIYTPHQDTVLRVFLVPGTLGVVASLLGFSASTALWMMTTRWITRRGCPTPDGERRQFLVIDKGHTELHG